MLKRIIIFILVLLVAAGAGYYFWYLPQQTEEITIDENPNVTRLADPTVISPINSLSNNSLWYGLSSGRLMQYDLNDQVATEYPVPPVIGNSFKKIYWPRQGSDFIAISNLEGDEQFSYFNFKEKRYYILPFNITNLDWVNNSAKIAIIWQSGDNKTYLVVSNPDATGYKVLRELPWSDMSIKTSPSTNSALLYRTNSGDETTKIYLFDLTTGEYIESVPEGRNTGAVWSPQGDGFAFTRLVNGKNQVYYHHIASGINTDLKLATGIDKIAFSQDGTKIYLASLLDDQPKENIWQYTIPTKEFITIFSSETMRVKNIIPIGSELYFLNQEDALYSLK